LFVAFAGKKQPKHVRKSQKKNSTLKWWQHSKQNFGKMLKFWSLESRSFWWSLGLKVL